MYYLTCETIDGVGTKIDLSKLPFFSKQSPGKILNIISFYNMFDTPEEMLDYLFEKGLVDEDALPDFRIVIKRKNKFGKDYYQVIPHSDIPLVSGTKKYFNKDDLRELITKKLEDNDFVKKLMDEFGFMKDFQSDTEISRYLTYIYGYNREYHEYERDAREEFERCVRKIIKVFFDSPKTFASLAMFTIDYVTPKVLKVSYRPQYLEDDDFEEEFLEANDFVKYNPGLTGKALEEAMEEEELFREQEYERQRKNMGLK